jgi:hypothetical protein
MRMTSAPCTDARFYFFFGAAFRERARKLRDSATAGKLPASREKATPSLK